MADADADIELSPDILETPITRDEVRECISHLKYGKSADMSKPFPSLFQTFDIYQRSIFRVYS